MGIRSFVVHWRYFFGTLCLWCLLIALVAKFQLGVLRGWDHLTRAETEARVQHIMEAQHEREKTTDEWFASVNSQGQRRHQKNFSATAKQPLPSLCVGFESVGNRSMAPLLDAIYSTFRDFDKHPHGKVEARLQMLPKALQSQSPSGGSHEFDQQTARTAARWANAGGNEEVLKRILPGLQV